MLLRAAALTATVLTVLAWYAPRTPDGQETAPATDPASIDWSTQPRSAAGPFDLVPAEALLAWRGQPLPADEETGQQSALDVGIRMLQKLLGGQLDPGAKMTLRLLEGMGAMIRHPFAFALVDVDTTPTAAGNVKGDDFEIAIIIDVDGDIGPMMQLVQRAVRELTDETNATLKGHETGGLRYAELRDKRLPDWCHIAWGQIDRYFVLTFGRGVWAEIAATARDRDRSLGRDKWLHPQRAKLTHMPLIEIVLDADGVREKLDSSTRRRASAFFRAWGAGKTERVFWAMGFVDRAVYCEAFFKQPDETVQRLYADPVSKDAELLATIPDEARYAIFKIALRQFFPRLFGSYYATRSAHDRDEAIEGWARIQQEHGFDAERDILANLGNRVVSHNYPRHPLNLPMMVTTLAPIERNARKVRDTIETMCTAWRDHMDTLSERDNYENPVNYDEDDRIWYLTFGPLEALAWTVTDKYIITSWSPDALRMFLEEKADAIGNRD